MSAYLEALEIEFDERRADFVADHEGAWVLLFTDGTAQFFDDEMDAANSGMSDPQRRQFMVKQALTEDHVVTISAAYIAS